MVLQQGIGTDRFAVSLPPPAELDTLASEVLANRHLARCERDAVDWIRQFHLADDPETWARMARTRPAVLAASCYRTASLDALRLGADVIAWLFLFDDREGEAADVIAMAERADEYELLLSGQPVAAGAGPLHLALADLRTRMATMCGEAWCERFCSSMRAYFDGCLLEVPYRLSGRSPSFRNYRLVRSWSIGTYPVLDLVEPALGLTLPDEVLARPVWSSLRELTVQLCAWTNDIYSFNKECGERDPINLVQVLRREHGLGLEAAYTEAIRFRQAELTRFRVLRARHDGAPDTSAVERAYVSSLEDWIHGNAEWSRSTVRYGAQGSEFAGQVWDR